MSNEAIEALIPQLDAVEESPGAAALRARSYELLRAAQGALVVDVGCGAGRAVAELADQGVRVMGIDVSDQMIALARGRCAYGEFRVGDANALPLGNGEAAGYRADKVIHALADPGRALAEARRVLAPGGRTVLCGQDWDAFVIDSADPALTRTIVQKRAGSPGDARTPKSLPTSSSRSAPSNPTSPASRTNSAYETESKSPPGRGKPESSSPNGLRVPLKALDTLG
jgi:SAM-dependent methyltransferase